MKISKLIKTLIKFRILGLKYVDFYVDDIIPPVALCTFTVSNISKTVTLINNSGGDYML